jgi:hypothetical protein
MKHYTDNDYKAEKPLEFFEIPYHLLFKVIVVTFGEGTDSISTNKNKVLGSINFQNVSFVHKILGHLHTADKEIECGAFSKGKSSRCQEDTDKVDHAEKYILHLFSALPLNL